MYYYSDKNLRKSIFTLIGMIICAMLLFTGIVWVSIQPTTTASVVLYSDNTVVDLYHNGASYVVVYMDADGNVYDDRVSKEDYYKIQENTGVKSTYKKPDKTHTTVIIPVA